MLSSAKTIIKTDDDSSSKKSKKSISSLLADFNGYSSSSSAKRSIGGGSFDREDPIDPTEPTDPPDGETYVEMDHPLSENGVLGKAITKAVGGYKKFDVDAAREFFNSDNSSAKPIVYSDWSPASRLFGMDQGTAFAEHMSNTAHQREVADLKAAGLNPVLGISGSGATAVSGNAAVGSSSAAKAESFPWLDVLGATAGLIATIYTGKPAVGYMIGNVFKAFE